MEKQKLQEKKLKIQQKMSKLTAVGSQTAHKLANSGAGVIFNFGAKTLGQGSTCYD
jgi:hypothetical protein